MRRLAGTRFERKVVNRGLKQEESRYLSHVFGLGIDSRATKKWGSSINEPQNTRNVSIIEPYLLLKPQCFLTKPRGSDTLLLVVGYKARHYRFSGHKTGTPTIDKQTTFPLTPSINRTQIFDTRAIVLKKGLDRRATQIRLTGHINLCNKLKTHAIAESNQLTNCFNKKNKTTVMLFKEIE